ncbi:MAG: hypothetical protein DBY00_04840 [Flavobacteriales bacterium]|nr:MAG: hypothetical protein DBY00_04840 [Flavobacteriales bacterium]
MPKNAKKNCEIIKKSSFLFYMNKKKAVPVLLNAYEPRIRQKMGRVFFDTGKKYGYICLRLT